MPYRTRTLAIALVTTALLGVASPASAHIQQTGFTVVWQDGDDRCLKESALIAETDDHTKILIAVSGKAYRLLSASDLYIPCTSPAAPTWTPNDMRGKYALQKYSTSTGWTVCRQSSTWFNPAFNGDTMELRQTFSETVCGSGVYRVKAVFQVLYNGTWRPTSTLTAHVHSPTHSFPT